MRISSIVKGLAAAIVAAALSAGAPAQTGNEAGPPQPPPSQDVLMGALTGGAAGMQALNAYFGPDTTPRDLVKRVDLLLQALRASAGRYAPQVLTGALDRIVNTALASLNAGHLVPLDVDPNTVPDATVPFEVIPGTGAAGAGGTITFKAPSDDPGPHRILIMLRNPSDPAALNAGFGGQIGVNDTMLQVHGGPPPDPSRAQALVVDATALDGQIRIVVPDTVSLDLLSIAVERADEPSRFITSPESLAFLVPLDIRLAIEAEIQALAAAFLDEVAPAAGLQQQLPPPVFQNEVTTSPS
jgi:hypothetical protein